MSVLELGILQSELGAVQASGARQVHRPLANADVLIVCARLVD